MARCNKTGQTALIADDDEYFRSALRMILVNALGFTKVVETASLDEAIDEMAKRKNLSLALFDLDMPGMTNAGSLKAVREVYPKVRVAVVSVSERRTDILQALEAGAHGYVPKSLRISALGKALQLICDGIIYVPASLSIIPPPREEEAGASPCNRNGKGLTLTPRQHDVLELIVEGQSNKHIARRLKLGEGTVKVHVAALFRVLGVSNRAAAAVAGARILSPG